MIGVVSGFLEEGSADTRSFAKKSIIRLAKLVNNNLEFEHLLKKQLSDVQVKKIMDIVKRGAASIQSPVSVKYKQSPGASPKVSRRRGIPNTDLQLEELGDSGVHSPGN